MKDKLIKFLNYAAVIAAILLSIVIEESLPLESMLKGKEEAVSLAMTEKGLPEEYIGNPAGSDIPRIEDIKTWEETRLTNYVTIEPVGIVSTGYGTRHPWVAAYTNASRRGGARKRADVTSTVLDVLGEYGEYYLLQLPDESYILAQMSPDDARKIKAGKEITLPVGRKKSADRRVLSQISDLCKKYDVDTEGVFYCIDDEWNGAHSTSIQLMRIGIIIVMSLVIGVILIMLIEKFLKEKKTQQD